MLKRSKRTINAIEKTTEFIHILFGLIAVAIVEYLYPEVSTFELLLTGIIGSFLPDLDHLLYFYTYGRKQNYSQHVRKMLNNFKIRTFAKFHLKNHKQVTGIITHNIISLLITLSIAIYNLFYSQNPVWGVFFLSWAFHYIWDIIEDLFYFGSLNSNWKLKFNRDDFKFFK